MLASTNIDIISNCSSLNVTGPDVKTLMNTYNKVSTLFTTCKPVSAVSIAFSTRLWRAKSCNETTT